MSKFKGYIFLLFLLGPLSLPLPLLAKPSTCCQLRAERKKCLKGLQEEATVVCGGRWYHYDMEETEYSDRVGYEDDVEPGNCVRVVEEVFDIPCDILQEYRVPMLFCRGKKKEICARLKEDYQGILSLLWNREKVKRKGERGKDLLKDLFRFKCE